MASSGPPPAQGPIPSVTAEMVPRHVRYHAITEEELGMVAVLSNSIHLAFLGITVGALVAFWITLKTVMNLTTDDRTMFRALMWLTGLLSAYFLAQSVADVVRSRGTLNSIKRRTADEVAR
jgi:hypothetical protein